MDTEKEILLKEIFKSEDNIILVKDILREAEHTTKSRLVWAYGDLSFLKNRYEKDTLNLIRILHGNILDSFNSALLNMDDAISNLLELAHEISNKEKPNE